MISMKTLEKIITSFKVIDKEKKSEFLKKIFFQANSYIDVSLEMLFFNFSNLKEKLQMIKYLKN